MLTRKDFPDGFLFGAATSAYQIEGHRFGAAGPTHWDTFAAQPGKVANRETGAVACEHYHRYEADLDLMRGFDAYRFSTSWARVLPEGRGAVNPQGLDFYDRLVDAVLARGLEPHLTLYHWELPAALAALGGWTNPDVVGWFGDFSEIVIKRIGDRLSAVATINEPWCVVYLSHFLGQHAPGLRDRRATARALHHVLLAHGETTARLRALGQKNIGIVLNFEAAQPARPSDSDAVARFKATMNRMFIEPLITGNYPALLLDGLGDHLPEGWQADMARISRPLDWLGVNYYTRQTVTDAKGESWPNYRFVPTDAPKTQMGWDIYPEGIYEILHWLRHEFTAGLPLFITENGMANDDHCINGQINDQARIAYISGHLQQVRRAVAEGGNIGGYFYWSLLDNFEWAFGYEKRFGLVHVDFTNQTRTPKASFAYLKKLAEKT